MRFRIGKLHGLSLFLIIISAFCIFNVKPNITLARSTIFSDDFDAPQLTKWVTLFGTWERRKVGGETYAEVGPISNNGYLSKTISIAGYENVQVGYRYRASALNNNEGVYFEWSDDGNNWHQLATYESNNGDATSDWVTVAFNLSSSSPQTLALRFIATIQDSNHWFRLDSVALTGDGKATAKISGNVFNDHDADGVRTTAEVGLNGWDIQLLGTDGTLISAVKSNTQGDFSFDNLPPGQYTLQEVLPSGWRRTYPEGSSYSITAAPDQIISQRDFGNVAYIMVLGMPIAVLNGAPGSTTAVLLLDASRVAMGSGNEAILLSRTTFSADDGSNFNANNFIARELNTVSNLPPGNVFVDGAVFGITGELLNADRSITVTINVGSSFVGETLHIFVSANGSRGWTQNGLLNASCIVNENGNCEFHTKVIGFFAITRDVPAATSTSGNSNGNSTNNNSNVTNNSTSTVFTNNSSPASANDTNINRTVVENNGAVAGASDVRGDQVSGVEDKTSEVKVTWLSGGNSTSVKNQNQMLQAGLSGILNEDLGFNWSTGWRLLLLLLLIILVLIAVRYWRRRLEANS